VAQCLGQNAMAEYFFKFVVKWTKGIPWTCIRFLVTMKYYRWRKILGLLQRGSYKGTDIWEPFWDMRKAVIFGNNFNKSKFYSGRN